MGARDHFRAHGRRRVDMGALLLVRPSPTQGGRAPQSVRIKNLGLGGACVELEGPSLDVDAPVALEVVAPTLRDPLVLHGRVAWVRRGSSNRAARAGIRFEHRESVPLYALFQLLGAHAFDA